MRIKFIGMILASIIGILANPEILAASDSVKISDLDQTNVAETVVVTAQAAKTEAKTEAKTAPAAPKAGVVEETTMGVKVAEMAKTPVKAQDQIKFSFGAQKLVASNTTALDAGNNAAKVDQMIYGHDYTSFGKITSLKIGDTFSVTVNGVTKNYRVVANPVDGTKGVTVKVVDAKKGIIYHEKLGNFYVSALMKGWTHDLALLTCYQGGRYIVVADEI